MGLFDKIFAKKEEKPASLSLNFAAEKYTVYAPAAGEVIHLAKLNDGVFSEGILGQGFAIRPEDETIYAPFDGVVENIADTRHAVGLLGNDGMELLIHVGLDTVDMNGQGFTVYVAENDKVTCGQPILTFSKKDIAAAGHSDAVIVVVVNSDNYKEAARVKEGQTNTLDQLLTMTRSLTKVSKDAT